MSTEETFGPAFPNASYPSVSYGLPFSEACRKHAERLNASCIYIIASGTLANKTSYVDELESALGSKVARVRAGLKPHTYMSEVLSIAQEVKTLGIDLLVTIGGSSLSDAAKIISMAVANDRTTPGDLKTLPHSLNPNAPAIAPTIPIICIPTTLSGAEYTAWAGVTEDATGLKYQFFDPLKAPRIIILDGKLACTMPVKSWLSIGVRALDYCVEALCSLENATKDGKRVPESDKACVEGLKELIPGLRRCKADGSDAEARFKCQLGAVKSLTALHMGVMKGASHGIGHMLGPFSVPHGETSCILLPAVCRFNAANFPRAEGTSYPGLKRQQLVAETLWTIPEAVEVFKDRNIERTADLGTLLDSVISELGMPRHLSEVGIERNKFDEIASHALQDYYLQSNPVPLTKGMEHKVKEILDMCA